MNATEISHSASGQYYENGSMYSASSGCVSMTIREDGLVRYEHHYYANLGDMRQELTREDYFKMLADIVAAEGTKHPRHGCALKVYVSVKKNVEVYDWEWTKLAEAAATMTERDRRRSAVAHVW